MGRKDRYVLRITHATHLCYASTGPLLLPFETCRRPTTRTSQGMTHPTAPTTHREHTHAHARQPHRARPPPPTQTERSLGWCALRAPPFTRTVAPPPGPRARAGSRAGQRSARPGAPPPATPWRRGRKVQSRTAPLCLWQSWGVDPPSRARRERAPVPHAVVEPLAACP